MSEKSEEQPYCEKDEMFLPDRYLLGTCPKCEYEKARGDECPKCGHWIESGSGSFIVELTLDPRCSRA